VNDVIRVLNLTGTTEGLFIGNLVVEREDWFWFAFHPFSGFEFKEVEPNIYEHWVHRNEHWPLFQGIFHTFPTEQSINLKDLYIKHPTKPNLWAFNGRSDDIVVLSNGYKISPLDTEALVTTHPAVNGALVIGTGKHQAGLLIELKESASRNDELFDSIWLTVERANAMSVHKNQLQRDYITFAEPDKPFVRTDKGTVKRRATLAIYVDYIERFYDSRSEDTEGCAVDTSSVDSITTSIRKIMGSLLPVIYKVSTDTDMFSLGLDSLQVFRAVKSIRAATGLQDQLAPRHLYANPTINRFSAVVWNLLEQGKVRAANERSLESAENDNLAKMKRMIDEHKRRQSIKMNPFDQVNFNHYMGLNFFFELRKEADFKTIFALLQQGLRRTFELIPALSGKIMVCSEGEIGYKKGDLCVTIPPLPSPASSIDDPTEGNAEHQKLNHLAYKDLSQVLPAFSQLRDTGFVHPKLKDELLLTGYAFPQLPADVLIAQANFVEGGCILAANFHHGCVDGVGVMIALRVWAESCRYIQGEESATCSWLDPESFNHSLPSILYAQEGYARPAREVDPGVWGFLPFLRPDEANGVLTNGTLTPHASGLASEKKLPPPPIFAKKFELPPTPPKDGRYLSTTTFLIPPEKIEQLRQEVIADPEAKGVVTSVSDILQAFFWRAAIRARYRVAKEVRGETFGPDDISILELPTDGRPYFSSLLPSSYMGSMLLLNRQSMPLEKLCDPQTSLGSIAYLLREAATRLSPSLFHDAFTLLNSLPNYDNFTIANMGIGGHYNAMISNLMLFQTSEISFGDNLFANGGSPEAMRPQIERGHKHFRFLVIYPMKSDGSAELVLGTLPEELDMFKTDEEFSKYATLVDTGVGLE
jgi:aryl carrier-like protein